MPSAVYAESCFLVCYAEWQADSNTRTKIQSSAHTESQKWHKYWMVLLSEECQVSKWKQRCRYLRHRSNMLPFQLEEKIGKNKYEKNKY